MLTLRLLDGRLQDQDVDQRDAGGDVKVEDANSQEV